MKVLIVLHTPRSRHSAVYIGYEQLAAYLADRGHSVSIVTPGDFPSLRAIQSRWYAVLYPFRMAFWLGRRRRDFDLAVWHSWAGWVSNVAGPRLRGAITAFHGLEPLYHQRVEREMAAAGRPCSLRYRLFYGHLIPALLARSCRRSDLVLCLNQEERDYLVTHGWASPAAVQVVGRGIAPEFFIDRAPRPVGRRLLYVGQWLEAKGTAYLVGAFERLARARPTVELHCVGTLASAETVRQAFAADVRERVSVRPTIEQAELPDVYREADAFLFPSLFDGFGRALLEAMATATPIAVTPCGWAQDVLKSGESCLMVPKRDASALAAAAERLLDDGELRVSLGRRAQQAARPYESERVGAHLLGLFERVLGSPVHAR